MCEPTGELRPHWEYLDPRARRARAPTSSAPLRGEVRRLLHENGVTYNVYDEPQTTERLWPLDPMPLLLTSTEWSAIEQGLIQRAELLDLMLADLYGPRELIRRGLLPPELVYAHPGFLRPCVGGARRRPHRCSLYAADLARTAGRAASACSATARRRRRAPATRSRTAPCCRASCPSLYRDSHVHRLALFFRAPARDAARPRPARGSDDPRIVLLTPGPGERDRTSSTPFSPAISATRSCRATT